MAKDIDDARYAHEAVLKAHNDWVLTLNEMRKGDLAALARMPEITREYQKALNIFADVSAQFAKKGPTR